MLEGHHFQNAYVTRDIEKWVAKFQEQAKVDRLIRYEGTIPVTTVKGPGEMSLKVAFIWIGDMQYELIQPIAGDVHVYADSLPADDSLVFHHVCMRMEDGNDFRARLSQQPFKAVLEGGDGESGYTYLDMREFLGHYVEFSWMPEAQWEGMGYPSPTKLPVS